MREQSRESREGTSEQISPGSGLRGYKKLVAWRKAHDLALAVYRFTSSFPAEEKYGISSQMKRAAVSVVANIVEGYMRDSTAQYRRGVSIARASLAELECFLGLACDLGLAPEGDAKYLASAVEELSRILTGLRAALTTKQAASPLDSQL